MAELGLGLGGLLGGNSSDVSKKVEVEMLDYGFIEGCSDVKLLHDIVSVLKSGKEGYYPDLIKFAETKLFSCMPEKDKKKYAALNHKVTVEEIQEAETELMKWQNEVAKVDATIMDKTSKEILSSSKPNIIPVRGTKVADKNESLGSSKGPSPSNTSKAVEDDSEDVLNNLAPPLMALNRHQRKKIKTLQDQLNVECLTALQRKKKANLERTKGNESFRNNEYEEAMRCYTKSLAFDHENAMAFANRAMAYIRLEIFDLAEEDSSAAIVLDEKYVKAYSRRGLVRFKRGKYLEAAADFSKALELDPSNSEAIKLLHNSKQKYLEVEGVEMPTAKSATVVEKTVTVEEVNKAEEKEEVTLVDSESITVENVALVEELGLPAAEMLLLSQDTLTVHVSKTAFYDTLRTKAVVEPTYVRIMVESDSDDDEDDDDDENNNNSNHNTEDIAEKNIQEDIPTTIAGFRRIAIEDDDDEDEEETDEVEEDCKTSNEKPEKVLTESSLPVPQPPESTSSIPSQSLPPQPPPPVIAEPKQEIEVDLEKLKLIGNQYMQQKKFAEAIAVYSDCLFKDRNYLPALNNRAQAYLTRKEYPAAIIDCCSVLSLDPGNCKALYRRAQAYHSSAESLPSSDLKERLSFLEQAKNDLFELLATGSATNADAANILLSRINKDCEFLLGQLRSPMEDSTTPSVTPSRSELIEQARVEREAAEKAAADELVLSTGSAEKELGNAAVQKKDMKTALQHYTRAIQLAIGEKYAKGTSDIASPLLSLAVSSFNNRSLAHLKLNMFREAIDDASFVVDHYLDGEGPLLSAPSPPATVVSKEMFLKAIFRRAQARHALSNGISMDSEKADVLQLAQGDLATALAIDPLNALAVKEQETVKLSLAKLHQKIQVQRQEREKKEKDKAKKEQEEERERQQRPSSPSTSLQSSPSISSNVDMVPRSSKRLQPPPSSSSSPAPSPSVISSPATPKSTPATSVGTPTGKGSAVSVEKPGKKAGDSPAPAFTLTVPEEPPKTTYELERIWRGLKDRPELFAKYLSVFKKSTYKKVIKESVTPDLLSSVFDALSAHTDSVSRKLSALEGLTEVPNFLLMVSVLPEQDMQRVKAILSQAEQKISGFDESAAEKKGEWQARVSRLRLAFRVL